jgi:phosphoglycerate dehydrogenase-like enzyme
MREKILEAAPGSRLIPVSAEGFADEPVDEVEVLLRGWSLGGDALDRLVGRAPKLRWIHSVSVGVESVLTPASAAGPDVTNGRGVFDQPIAEYVMTMILAICRRLPQLLELQRERTWQPLEAGSWPTTIGLVGLGGIGREVAEAGGRSGRGRRRPAPSGVGRDAGRASRSSAASRRCRSCSPMSDFVVLALPLTTETDASSTTKRSARRQAGSWLINVARGALVDELALLRALRDGPLGGAVLDTFREEPLPEIRRSTASPTASSRLTRAGRARDGVLGRTLDVFCDNLRRYRAGEPLNTWSTRGGLLRQARPPRPSGSMCGRR